MAKSDLNFRDDFTAEYSDLGDLSNRRKRKATFSVKTMLAYSLVFVLTTAAFVRFFTNGEATLWGQSANRGPPKGIEWKSIKYSVVEGYFKQDQPETDQFTFDYISENFGLLDTFPTAQKALAQNPELKHKGPMWKEFKEEIRQLNKEAPPNVQYKVFFLARHGQAMHNAASLHYGKEMWSCYWSLLDGNGTHRWDDPKLTHQGTQEAKAASKAWQKQLAHGAPFPDNFFVSPLTRPADTLMHTWSNVFATMGKKAPRPVVTENLRETLGVHTCDRRISRCQLSKNYPMFDFEPGFPNIDPLWAPVFRETLPQRKYRLRKVLDSVVTNPKVGTFISFTAHGGAINSTMENLGHREWKMKTGEMIPVVVKVEFLKEKSKKVRVGPSETAPVCTSPPTIVPPPPGLGEEVYGEDDEEEGKQ